MVTLGQMNAGAKLWWSRGLNVFPGNSKEKATYEDWDAYHYKPIPQEIFDKWIKEGKFLSGISVSPGVVYRIPELEGWYAVCIDWDKIEGFNALFPGKTVEEVAQEEYIEWHDDDKTRGHLWAYVPIMFPKKEPDLILGLEVKGLNEHGVMVSFPSIHKNGHQHKPVGTDKINRWNKEKAETFLNNIVKACNEQGIEYPKVRGHHHDYSTSKRTYSSNQPKISAADFEEPIRVMLQTWPIKIDTSIEITEGVRHDVLVFTANSILFRYYNTKSHKTLEEIFRKINYTLCKPDPSPNQEITRIWTNALQYVQAAIEREKIIPKEIAERLNQLGVYKIVKENPTTLYLADRRRDQILKAVILKPRTTVETESKEDQDKTTKTQTRMSPKGKQLLIKDIMIDAIPTDVTIFSNPVDAAKAYKATFRHKNANGITHYLTVGPGTVSYLLQELRVKGRFVKGKESDEALQSLLIEYEDRGIAKIDNRMPQPGYYLIDGKVRGYDVTQRLGEPIEQSEILACIGVLDELVNKYRNRDIGPTIIKHAIPSPFGYIKKGLKVSGDNWVPGIYEYGFTRVGKNTAGIIHLAIWRKHGIKDKEAHQLGFSGIDTAARFGNAISRSTYEVMISEVGSLVDAKFLWLSEMIKHAIESQTVRGKYIEGFFKGIPALSVPILTSNYLPPTDPAFRSRFILIHWGEKDLPSVEEKAAFKKWFFDERRDEILGTLGDFTANYVMAHPEILSLYWEDIAKKILVEFYKVAGQSQPAWLDSLVEQDQIEAHVEEGKLKLRAFFVRAINETYSAYIRTLTPKDEMIVHTSVVKRFEECIKHDLVPYLSQRSDRAEIVITADIFEDLKRLKIESLTSLKDLASMIGGAFESCTRRINGSTTKVAAGSLWDFENFLRKEIMD